MAAKREERALTKFDIFVLALSVLSMANILLILAPLSDPVTNVVFVVDGVLCLVFMADFLARLKHVPVKRVYLIDDKGWLDLLGSLPIPGLRLARLVRMVRIGRVVGHYRLRGVWRMAVADRAGSALLGALFLTIIVLQLGSMFILGTEADNDDANIKSASDALWWSYVTVTTVGYGDRYPVSNQGRLVGVGMLTVGIGLFSVLTGFLANTFLAPKHAESAERQGSSESLRLEIEELKQLVRELGDEVTRRDRR